MRSKLSFKEERGKEEEKKRRKRVEQQKKKTRIRLCLVKAPSFRLSVYGFVKENCQNPCPL